MSILLRMYPGDAWALLIANVLVQVTVVTLTAWLLARVASRWNAAWRHSIYLVAIACVLASPALAWAMQASGMVLVTLHPSAPPVPLVEPASIPAADAPESLPSGPSSVSAVPLTLATPEMESLSKGLLLERPPTSLVDVLRAFATVACVAWLLGIVWLVARWCHGLRLIAALRRAAQPLDGEVTAGLLDQVRRVLGVARLPPVAIYADLDRPIMVGLFHPLVILPEHVLRTLHEAELADVLVHECAHAVCRHQMVGFVQRLAGTLFWPHPLVHLLNRELARAREEVCDNYVLRRSAALRYARTLLELSQLLVDVPARGTALGLFPCRWRLEDRVADLLDPRRKAMVQVSRWAAAALTAAFLLLGLLIAGTRATAAPAEEKLSENDRQHKAAAAPGVEKPGTRPAEAGADNRSGWKVLHCVSSGVYGCMESKYMDRRDVDHRLPSYEPVGQQWPPVSILQLSAEQRKKLEDVQSAHWTRRVQLYMKEQASPSGRLPPTAYSRWLEVEKPLVRKQVEEILTPQQVQELHEFAFRSRAFLRLNDARRSELGLTAQQNAYWLSLTKAMDRRFQAIPDKMLAVLTPRQRVLFREELLGPFGIMHYEQATVQLESQTEPLHVVTLHPFPDFGKEELQRQLHLTASQQQQVRHILGDSADARDKLIRELMKLAPGERKKLSDEVKRGVGRARASSSSSKLSAEELKKLEAERRRTARAEREADKKEWEQRSQVKTAIALRKQFEALLTPGQLIAYQDMAARDEALGALYDTVMWEQIGASEEQKLELSRIVNQESIAGFQEAIHQSVGKMLEMLTPTQRKKLREAVEQELRGVPQPLPPSFSRHLAPGESPGAKCA